MSKKSCFRGYFEKQHGKRAQVLLKCALQHLYDIHRSLRKRVSAKKSHLLPRKILGCLLTYWLPMKSIFFFIGRIQGHQFRCNYLRSKNLFLSFFVSFLKSRLNFEHFDRKDDPHTFCISEITDSENVVKKMSKSPV